MQFVNNLIRRFEMQRLFNTVSLAPLKRECSRHLRKDQLSLLSAYYWPDPFYRPTQPKPRFPRSGNAIRRLNKKMAATQAAISNAVKLFRHTGLSHRSVTCIRPFTGVGQRRCTWAFCGPCST